MRHTSHGLGLRSGCVLVLLQISDVVMLSRACRRSSVMRMYCCFQPSIMPWHLWRCFRHTVTPLADADFEWPAARAPASCDRHIEGTRALAGYIASALDSS